MKKNSELIEQHQDVLDTMQKMYVQKNHDYGNSFSKQFAKYGIVSCMVRLEDKWNRLEKLVSNDGYHKVVDERLEDTILDMANYLIMTYMELENKKLEVESLSYTE